MIQPSKYIQHTRQPPAAIAGAAVEAVVPAAPPQPANERQVTSNAPFNIVDRVTLSAHGRALSRQSQLDQAIEDRSDQVLKLTYSSR